MLLPRRRRFGPEPGAAAVAFSGLGFGSEETEWKTEPMGQRESPRVSVIWAGWLCFIGPSKYSYLQLNQSPFSGYLRLTAAISVSDHIALKIDSPSCCLPQQLSPAIAQL